jgi:hypothetical protein
LIASKRLSFHPLHFALLSNRLSAIVRIAVKTTVPDNANATFEAGTTALLLEMFSFEPFFRIFVYVYSSWFACSRPKMSAKCRVTDWYMDLLLVSELYQDDQSHFEKSFRADIEGEKKYSPPLVVTHRFIETCR